MECVIHFLGFEAVREKLRWFNCWNVGSRFIYFFETSFAINFSVNLSWKTLLALWIHQSPTFLPALSERSALSWDNWTALKKKTFKWAWWKTEGGVNIKVCDAGNYGIEGGQHLRIRRDLLNEHWFLWIRVMVVLVSANGAVLKQSLLDLALYELYAGCSFALVRGRSEGTSFLCKNAALKKFFLAIYCLMCSVANDWVWELSN